MTNRSCWNVAISLSLICASTIFAQDSRTWHNRNGQAIAAVFDNYDSKNKTVELNTADGETIEVPLEYLSAADQRYVKRVARKTNGDKVNKAPKSKNKLSLPTLASKSVPTQRRNSKQERLFGINWTLEMEEALRLAKGRESESDDRPVMWMRVLGELKGFM